MTRPILIWLSGAFAGVLLCAAMSPLVRAPVHTMVIVGFVAVFFAAVAWAQGRGR